MFHKICEPQFESPLKINAKLCTMFDVRHHMSSMLQCAGAKKIQKINENQENGKEFINS